MAEMNDLEALKKLEQASALDEAKRSGNGYDYPCGDPCP